MMDINNYFDKYENRGNPFNFASPGEALGDNLHDSNYNVAIIGVKHEMPGTGNAGSALAPDEIRKFLYPLCFNSNNLKISDLGNIKNGISEEDTFCALKDITENLSKKGIITIVIGGTQNLTVPIFEGLERNGADLNLLVLDDKIDLSSDLNKFDSRTFLNKLINKELLYRLEIIGNQNYLCSKSQFAMLKERGFFETRLGELRENLTLAEPLCRDCDIFSMDMSAIKQCDAPAVGYPSPNGILAEEACKLAHFAGFSDRISVFGLFNMNPYFDQNGTTAALAAQIIWHFIEGLDNRYGDYPIADLSEYQKFIIPDMVGDMDRVFYRNRRNNRWWTEIPTKRGLQVFSCSEEDYTAAIENQMPKIWLKYFMR